MNILETLFISPILTTLLLYVLFILLFTAGMSSGFRGSRQRRVSFVGSLANGWVRGWVLISIPVFLWGVMGFYIVLSLLLDTGFDNTTVVFIYFFTGITILIFTPGINIAQRIRAHYPTTNRKVVVVIASLWALVFPVCLLAVSALVALAAHLRLLPWSLTLISDILLLTGFAFLISLLVSKAVGRRATAWQLPDVIEPSSPDTSETATAHPWAEHIPLLVLALVERISAMPALSRAKIGWAVIWILLNWGTVANFNLPRGLSTTSILGYAAGFSIITALLVSGGAGATATLLLRSISTPWRETRLAAIRWITAGLRGWGFGLFFGFMITMIYQLIQIPVKMPVLNMLIIVARTGISSMLPWYISGLIALLIAYTALHRTPTSITAQPVSLPLIVRGTAGWIIVWGLLTWVIAGRFGLYGGFSNSKILWFVLRFCLLIASVVSLCAGLVAALLMRESSTSWRQTWKAARIWITSGFVGWGIGLPFGWIAVAIYQLAIGLPPPVIVQSETLTRVGTAFNDTVQSAFLIGGIIALVAGYIKFRPKYFGINS